MPESWAGPDLFGFYKHEVVDLLTEDEDFLVSSTTHKDAGNASLNSNENGEGADGVSVANPLFVDSLQHAVSDVKRELLKSTLRQSVRALAEEVNEMVDPVKRIRRVMTCLRSKKQQLNRDSTSPLSKKKKTLSNARRDFSDDQDGDGDKETEFDKNLKILLESGDALQLEETMSRHFDELDEALSYREEQLEGLLDAVVSKCRLMTKLEKMHLCVLIKKLPQSNLDRMVNIIQRDKSANASNELVVELEDLGNATLWRLYFYVKVVENTGKLSA